MRNAIRLFSLPHWLLQPHTPTPHSLWPLSSLAYRGGGPAIRPLFTFALEGAPGWLSYVLMPRLPCRSESRPEHNPWPVPTPPPLPICLASPSSSSNFTAGFHSAYRLVAQAVHSLTSCAARPEAGSSISVQQRGFMKSSPLAPSASHTPWVCPADSAENLAGGQSRRPCCCICIAGPGNP